MGNRISICWNVFVVFMFDGLLFNFVFGWSFKGGFCWDCVFRIGWLLLLEFFVWVFLIGLVCIMDNFFLGGELVISRILENSIEGRLLLLFILIGLLVLFL